MMQTGKFKDEAVTVVRQANAGDGPDFDPKTVQYLIVTKQGKMVVAASDVAIDPEKVALSSEKASTEPEKQTGRKSK